MFIKYDPEEDKLLYCKYCRFVFHKQTIKQYDEQHTCPMCGCKGNIEENYNDNCKHLNETKIMCGVECEQECCDYVKETNLSELNAYKLLLDSAFRILLNANDFFGYACADAVELDTCDLTWVIPIVQKYGDDGVSACMHYIRQQVPLQKYLTEKEHKAYKEIEELKPKVWSESEK